MTTHDQHARHQDDATEFTTAPADFTDGQVQNGTPPPIADPAADPGQAAPSEERLAPQAVAGDEPVRGADPVRAAEEPAHSQQALPSDDALFADHDLSELRARWNDVQATFVDDPRDCVQKADGLVSDTVEQLTSSFSQARSRLEEQWSRGEEASTEELRLALKRYRDFFDRLLAV